MITNPCPECGTDWQEPDTCQDAFHQFLYWENQGDGDDWSVHHLMVICYHLQHPSILSMDWLKMAKTMLVDFLEAGVTPQEMRSKYQAVVDSKNRNWKIKAAADNHGTYVFPIHWTQTTKDVLLNGPDSYPASVKKWAAAILDDLRQSGNLGVSSRGIQHLHNPDVDSHG